jgi:hypothetical protein
MFSWGVRDFRDFMGLRRGEGGGECGCGEGADEAWRVEI